MKLLKPILLAVVLTCSSLPALADSIADKVEQLGEMKYLKVSGIRLVKRNELLNIQVEVTNSDNSNQSMFYRFKWLDASGFSVWGEEVWKPLTIYGLQKKLINEVAPTPAATDFRIEVQSPSNTGKAPQAQ
ncbi:YcfL family protein [Chitinivorax sp. PXF-14]|uniref:YcfL family protein n=1 Tax=Chitinivorax sp. PXF-14 TaxID=3230488 RepID=UPI0034674B45